MLTKSPFYYYFGDPQPYNTFSDGISHQNISTDGSCSRVTTFHDWKDRYAISRVVVFK